MKELVMSEPSFKEEDLEFVREMIRKIGDDPNRPGLVDTPRRVLKAWREIFSGYGHTPQEYTKTFDDPSLDQIVVLRGCEFFSFCEHHILPFFGVASIGYIASGRVLGLSKLARIVDLYARRLQVQERMAKEIADAVEEMIKPKGVAVVVEGVHTCMSMRGVSKQRAKMTTSVLRGRFLDNEASRNEVMGLLRSRLDHE